MKLINIIKNEKIQPFAAMSFFMFGCFASYLFGLYLDRDGVQLLSPIPESYTYEFKTTLPVTIPTESITTYVAETLDLSHIKSDRLEIVAYIKEVFGEDSDDALWLLVGDGKHSTCANGENTNIDPLAEHFNPNGSVDRGVFQINSIHGRGELDFDYKENINFAYNELFKNQGFKPWTCSVVLNKENYLGFIN